MSVALGLNGQGWMLSAGDEQIQRCLTVLDGDRWNSLVLWRVPPGVDFRDCNLETEVEEYIQCAGSADRLTIETRERAGADLVQLVVGLPTARLDAAPSEEVRWGDRAVFVYDNELFDAARALPIFIEYAATGRLPEGLTARKLVL